MLQLEQTHEMSFSGFSFPATGQNPQQNTGTQGTSGSAFSSFAAGLGGGANTSSTGDGLLGGGSGAAAASSNAPPSLFGGGTATGTTGGNALGGGFFGPRPATGVTGGGLFGNLGQAGTTLGGTAANTNPSTIAPSATTSGSNLFPANPYRTRLFLCICATCSLIFIQPTISYWIDHYTCHSRNNVEFQQTFRRRCCSNDGECSWIECCWCRYV